MQTKFDHCIQYICSSCIMDMHAGYTTDKSLEPIKCKSYRTRALPFKRNGLNPIILKSNIVFADMEQ